MPCRAVPRRDRVQGGDHRSRGGQRPAKLAYSLEEAGHDGAALHQPLLAIEIDVDRTIEAAAGALVLREHGVLHLVSIARPRSAWVEDAGNRPGRLCGRLDSLRALSRLFPAS